MKKSINGTVKFWRVALRELYHMGLIEESDFIHMHKKDFVEGSTSTEYEYKVMQMVQETIKSKEIFIPLIREEIAFISKGGLPESKFSFKKMWLSYLLDCLEANLIEESDFLSMKEGIDFNVPDWTEAEHELVYMVLDMLRVIILEENPNALDYFENLSFDLLMHVNGIQ
jgi:hypothetical protein